MQRRSSRRKKDLTASPAGPGRHTWLETCEHAVSISSIETNRGWANDKGGKKAPRKLGTGSAVGRLFSARLAEACLEVSHGPPKRKKKKKKNRLESLVPIPSARPSARRCRATTFNSGAGQARRQKRRGRPPLDIHRRSIPNPATLHPQQQPSRLTL